jgi:omega-amidase
MAAIYQKKGCSAIFYPGAFNMTTGPAHWELLIRSRALDNQLYVAAISPARNLDSDYKAWGYSTISNPYAEIVAKAGHDEEIIYAEIGWLKLSIFKYQNKENNQ